MMKDFLILYDKSDHPWAEWIAWQLGNHGHATIMHQHNGTFSGALISDVAQILVLSPAFIAAVDDDSQWLRPVAGDSIDAAPKRIGVCVKPVALHGSMEAFERIDLFETGEQDALLHLLEATSDGSVGLPPLARLDGHAVGRQGAQRPAYPGTLPAIWNIPEYRNPNFTGRDAVLSSLGDAFSPGSPAASVQTIKGMGGVGKTQIAVEYAYRYANDYQAIWWLRSGDTEDLAADFAAFAGAAGLTKKHARNHRTLLNAVREWLKKNRHWLFIFDNVVNPEDLREYLPADITGHILITSRHQTWEKICPSISIAGWSNDDAVAYLGKRIDDHDPPAAQRIADALKGLPLALEQAAAYMVENNIRWSDYLRLYQARRDALWEGKALPLHYPATIGTTVSMAIEKIEARTRVGSLVLAFCAYLAPESVPLSMINAASACVPDAWSEAFGDATAHDEAIDLLNRYALVSARSDRLSTHRLIQMAMRGRLAPSEQLLWSEIALVSTINMLPGIDGQDHPQWADGTDLPSHVRTAMINAIDYGVDAKTLAPALHRFALYLQACGWLKTAENCFHRALEIYETQSDADYFITAVIVGDLAGLHYTRERYSQAERRYRQALEIVDAHLGADHPLRAISLNNLALSLHGRNQFAEAERILRQALDFHEAQSDAKDPFAADTMNNLALVLQDQGRYADAEPLCRNALEIRQAQFGNEHFDVADSLSDLAGLLQEKDQYDQAEPLFRQALEILEKRLGPNHPRVADNLLSLASLLHDQENFTQAEPHYRRALEIYETQLGDDHPSVAMCLNNLARLLHDQEDFAHAEPHYRRALEIYETQLGDDHPSVAMCLNNLARLLHDQEDFAHADPLYRRTLNILDKQLGNDHPDFAVGLNNLQELLNDSGRPEDAGELLSFSATGEIETG